MPYGTIKVDNITFTDNSVDKTVSLSGLIQNPTFTGNVTVTGTISGDVIRGGTTISGVTVTGTTANFVSGVFTTQLSGATILATTGNFTSLTGTTTTGTTANFVSGVFTTQLSGATITGTTANFTSGNFTSLSGTTTTVTSGVFSAGSVTAPSVAVGTGTTYKPGIYSPGTDQLAISTNGTSRIVVDASGNVNIDSNTFYVDAANNYVGIGNTSPASELDVKGEIRIYPASGNATVRFGSGGVEKGKIAIDSSSNLLIETAGTERARIRGDGTFEIKGAGTAGVSPAVSVNPSAPANSAVIDSSGRLGLGTSGPTQKLTVAGNILALNAAGTDGYINAVTTGIQNTYLGFNNSGSTNSNGVLNNYSYVGNGNAYGLQFLANGAVAATLDTSGRLGIGTNSPTESVHTAGALRVTGTQTAAGTGIYLDQTSGVGNVSVYGPDASTQGTFRIYTATSNGGIGSVKLTLDSSGRVGIGATSPGSLLDLSTTTSAKLNLTYPGFGIATLASDSTGSLLLQADEANTQASSIIQFKIDGGEKARIDTSGNMGIGVVPSAQYSTIKALQVGALGATIIAGNTSAGGTSSFGQNFYTDPTTATYKYAASSYPATTYNQYNGEHRWLNAPSGTAGNTITFTQAMTLDASGRLGIGTTSPAAKLEVAGGNIRLDNNQGVEWGGANNYIYGNESTDFIAIATNGTERARITSAGLVGIGTTPAAGSLLHINSAASTDCKQQISVTTGTQAAYTAYVNTTASVFGNENSSGGSLAIGSAPYATVINNGGAYPINFATNNTLRATIDSSGRLLVGTSTARTVSFWDTPRQQFEGTSYQGGGLLLYTNENSIYGANLGIGKSRGTAIGDNTIVQSNDYLGTIIFYGSDGSNEIRGAEINAFVDGTPGTNDMPSRLVFSTTADNEASPTERMRINRAGQISSYALAGASSFNLVLSHGSAASSSVWMIAGAYGATGVNTGTTSFLVATNGNVTNTNNSYGAISDAKLKENIVDATPQWDDLKALQVRKYNFKEGQTHTQIGLVAQEVELISPGLVTESPDRDKEGNDLGTVTKSVNYSVLYMKAVKALQEAMERIESLEASNADMLARLTTLEAA